MVASRSRGRRVPGRGVGGWLVPRARRAVPAALRGLGRRGLPGPGESGTVPNWDRKEMGTVPSPGTAGEGSGTGPGTVPVDAVGDRSPPVPESDDLTVPDRTWGRSPDGGDHPDGPHHLGMSGGQLGTESPIGHLTCGKRSGTVPMWGLVPTPIWGPSPCPSPGTVVVSGTVPVAGRSGTVPDRLGTVPLAGSRCGFGDGPAPVGPKRCDRTVPKGHRDRGRWGTVVVRRPAGVCGGGQGRSG